MKHKPSIPQGTRDFSPEKMGKRNYIFQTIRDVFHLFGFQQIETPAIENLSTLMGKYGEEGDKLLYKILNSGDFLSNTTDEELLLRNPIQLTNKISEKGLRYDLTVPFARFVVMHRNEITFPFRRYQIQPVWRADRPQKGRYREFYQCDVDVVGSDSLLYEVEFFAIIDEVFRRLGLHVCIKLNNRKILSGIAEMIGEADRMIDITIAIDKLDKTNLDTVNEELRNKGVSEQALSLLQPVILLQGDNHEKLTQLKALLRNTTLGLKGIEEIEYMLGHVETLNLSTDVEIDLTLARGLNYYTGSIFEVKTNEVEIGSIAGGGRYDNLTGVFGMEGVSGVGMSFGAERIFDLLNLLERFPTDSLINTQVLFVNFGEKEVSYLLPVLSSIRTAGIRAELYPEASKLKKQLGYADSKKIPFVALVGANEMAENKINLKNMLTGQQQLVTSKELIHILKMIKK
jgi:histidyl-tRNA synthetase